MVEVAKTDSLPVVKTDSLTIFTHVFTAEKKGKIDDYYELSKKILGEGSYGQVYKGKQKDTNQIRAVKAMDPGKIVDQKRFEQEIAIQQQLDHPNIVKLFEIFRDAKRIYLVMEMCTGGELFDRIVEEAETKGEGQAFDERGAANYMQQILGAMRYLHDNNYVHRDIKPENFLLASKAKDAPIKVIDFGLAKNFVKGKDAPMKTKAGTPYYVAPQVLQGSYDEKCDVWSCGVITYILLCGYPPFYGDTDEDILKRVKACKFDFPSPDWDDISKAGKEIIKLMLTKDAEKRPSASELLEHKWLRANADELTGTVPKTLGTNMKNFTGGSKLKKLALTVIASQIKESEIEEMKNTFMLLDKNKDGTLTLVEMEEAFAKHKVDIGDRETLQKLDTDGSGTIDYTEFIAATIDKSKYLKEEVLWAAFRTFDEDGDGTITKEEVNKLLGGKMKDEQLDQFVCDADLDGDGEISFEEFKEMMRAA